jgi:hypothetical protein
MSATDRAIATVLRLIKKNGQNVVWRKTVRTPDAQRPWNAADSAPVDNAVVIAWIRKSGSLAEAIQHILKGTEVNVGSQRGLMGAVSFVPDLTDKVVRNGVTLPIKAIEAIAPAGIAVLYIIEFA